jgi:hypothetical protein
MDLHTPFILFVQNVKDLATPANAMPSLKYLRVVMPLAFPVTIDVGGDGAAAFLADSVWSATKQYGSVGGTRVAIPAGTPIGNASVAQMTRSTLRGLAGYKVRVPNGTYTVTQYFTEDRYTETGKRVFKGYIEGKPAFSDLDLVKASGGRYNEYSVVTTGVVVGDNMLDLSFTASVDSTTLSGLKIEREGGTLGVNEVRRASEEMSFAIYPNPMNTSARFVVTQSVTGPATLSVYDQLGREVSMLPLGTLDAGRHEFTWSGERLASGIYYCRFTTPSGTLTRRALLMK